MSQHRIVPRSEWDARYGRGGDASSYLPWSEVVVHTEAGAVRDGDWPTPTEAALLASLSEKQHIQAVERYHSVNLGWSGVGYSFLISRDGTIFEGRGWGRSGAHTETRNSTALGLCFLGHGDLQPATGAQWSAAQWLIGEGIRLGYLTRNPKITGHRNYSTKGKTCPGNLIYPSLYRLRGILGPTPTTKDWFDMATKEELRAVVREELADIRREQTWARERIVRIYAYVRALARYSGKGIKIAESATLDAVNLRKEK